jgi:hypothetical protein
MTEGKHIVQKFVFDITYDSEENAYKFQTWLSDFIKEKIVPLTNEVLSETTRGYLVSTDQLTLDLGEISLAHCEEEIYQKIRSQLYEKITLLLAGHYTGNASEKITFLSKEHSDLQILDFFLQNGFLPWNVHQEVPSFSVKQLLLDLIEQHPVALKIYLEKVVSDNVLLTRLVRQFEDAVIWRIIALWNEEPAYLKSFYQELVALYKKKSIIKNSFSEFRDLIWPFLLKEVVLNRKVRFENIPLVEELLNFVSEETSIEYYNVVLSFYNSIDEAINTSMKSASSTFMEGFKAVVLKDSFTDTALKKKVKELDEQSSLKSKKKKEDSPASKASSVNEPVTPTDWNNAVEDKSRYAQQKEDEFILTKFLALRYGVLTLKKSAIHEMLPRVERSIKALLISNPDFVRRNFAIAGWTLEEPVIIYYLDLFSADTRKVLILHLFNKTEAEFSDYVQEQERGAVQRFLETGHIPVLYQKPFRRDVKTFQNILLKTATQFPEWFQAVFKRTIIESWDKDIKIALFTEVLPPEVLQRVFRMAEQERELNVFLRHFGDTANAETTSVKDSGLSEELIERVRKNQEEPFYFALKLSEINSPESALYHLSVLLRKPLYKAAGIRIREKSGETRVHVHRTYKVPENSEVKIDSLVPLIFEKYPGVAIAYFKALTVKEQKVVLKVLQPEKLERIERLIKGHDTVFEDLIKGIRGEQRLVEEPKAVAVHEDTQQHKELKLEYRKLESGEPVYIGNAGLVLLHPYLPRFFKLLNLTEGRAFKDEFSAHKAAHLLQYLANKNTSSEEHEMVLNKLICGIELTTPLLRDIEITEEEIETCEGLLEGVIQNWTILKKTSNDNLRASFLMRQGRLVLESKGWKLRVEEKPYDILVEKLPWGISMIKMPWMNTIIYVEWK